MGTLTVLSKYILHRDGTVDWPKTKRLLTKKDIGMTVHEVIDDWKDVLESEDSQTSDSDTSSDSDS